MNKEKYKIVNAETIHQGYCRVDRYLLQNKLFSGEWSKPYLREVVRRYNAAGALLFDSSRNQVVMIEQFRAGAIWEKSDNPWLFEIIAGVTDKDEDLEDLVRREAIEEAGLEVLDLIPIYHYLTSPGGSSEEMTLFLGRVDASKAPQYSGLADENEDIKVHVMDLADAISKVKSGRIHNASSIIALQWLELNLPDIQKKWGIAK